MKEAFWERRLLKDSLQIGIAPSSKSCLWKMGLINVSPNKDEAPKMFFEVWAFFLGLGTLFVWNSWMAGVWGTVSKCVVLMYGQGSRQATQISYGKFTLFNAADIKFIREKHWKKLQHQKCVKLKAFKKWHRVAGAQGECDSPSLKLMRRDGRLEGEPCDSRSSCLVPPIST